jgi:hypothetical protein
MRVKGALAKPVKGAFFAISGLSTLFSFVSSWPLVVR